MTGKGEPDRAGLAMSYFSLCGWMYMQNQIAGKILNKKMLVMLALSLGMLLSDFAHSVIFTGKVYTRETITDEAGNKTWVEYDPDTGEQVRVVDPGEQQYPSENWRVMSVHEYNDYKDDYEDLKNKVAGLEAPLSRSDYESKMDGGFLAADGETVIQAPPLNGGTAYVVVLPRERRFTNDPASLILGEYPFDPSSSHGVTSSTLSMLVNHDPKGFQMGVISEVTDNRLAFQSAFLLDDQGKPIPASGDFSQGVWRRDNEDVAGPIPHVVVDAMPYGASASGEDGQYNLITVNDLFCPVPTEHSYYLTARFSYRRFNPKGINSTPFYFIGKQAWSHCAPLYAFAPFLGPISLGVSDGSATVINMDFRVDVAALSGTALFSSVAGVRGDAVDLVPAGVQVLGEEGGNTQYEASDPDLEKILPSDLDFDRDGTDDYIALGHFEEGQDGQKSFIQDAGFSNQNDQVIGVWFSSVNQREERVPGSGLPDLTRVIDNKSYRLLQHEGFLKQITAEEVRNTDVYVVRVSDGKLLAERIGLHQEEAGASLNFGEHEALNGFYYTTLIRGGHVEGDFAYRRFDELQSRAGVNPELHERKADHLKPGDRIRIYAINRATGYMGSVETTVQGAGDGGELTFPIDPILMGPPNLRIWAERSYDIKAGLTKGELREDQIIGFEGGSLSSDRYVAIYTQWLDHKGRPIPEALEGAGYTGRLAVLAGDKTLPSDAQGVYQFDVNPGHNLQVIRLNQDTPLNNQHYYIHVSGEPGSGNPVFADTENKRVGDGPDFSSTGQNPGILSRRPDNYVPFLVKVYDRTSSDFQNAAFTHSLQDGTAAPEDKPAPIYRWLYRPEMQFSTYSLNMEEMHLTTDFGGQSSLDIDHNLSTTTLDPLDRFTGDIQMVFSAGMFQALAELNGNDTALMASESFWEKYIIGSEDILAVNLAQANDYGNTLYEYMGVPLVLPSHKKIRLNRTHALGSFNPEASNSGSSDVTDGYQHFKFALSQRSQVEIAVTDAKKNEVKTLASGTTLPSGGYSFVLTYGDVSGHILPRNGVDFYLHIKAQEEDGYMVHDVYIPGDMIGETSSEMLGNVIEHDTLIQRGSLTLSREDLTVKGRGPDLTFVRSYSNETRTDFGGFVAPEEPDPLGVGWSHNHKIFVKVVHEADTTAPTTNNLPQWVLNARSPLGPKILPLIGEPQTVPKQVLVSNAGMFKNVNGTWHAQRGRHGKLVKEGEVWTYTSKDGTRYVFKEQADSEKRFWLDYIEDRNGNKQTYTYSQLQDIGPIRYRLDSITDAVGRQLTFSYEKPDGLGERLVAVEGPGGSQFEFEYYPKGDPAEGMLKRFVRGKYDETYEYALNEQNGFIKDPTPNLVTVTDANDHAVSYQYMDPTRVPQTLVGFARGIQKTDVVKSKDYPDSTSASFVYESSAEGNQRVVNDPNGVDTHYQLNAYGNPIKIKKPEGYEVAMTWSVDVGKPDNLVVSRTDEYGVTTDYEYDAQGNVTKENNSAFGLLQQEWDQDFSILTHRTDREGNTYDASLDGNGNILSETRSAMVDGTAKDVVVTHTYYDTGERKTTKDGRGNTTSFTYDSHGLPDVTTGPDFQVVDKDYDVRGRLEEEADANGNVTSYTYNELDRLTQVDGPAGYQVTYTYDDLGNKKSEKTKDQYLAAGTTHTRSLALSYDYDERDRVKTISRSGSVSGLSGSDIGGSRTFTYDGNSNVLTESDWKGATTSHDYDDLNRKVSTTNRDDKTMTVDWTFLSGGYTKTITDYEGRVTKERYDSRGLVTRVDLPTVEQPIEGGTVQSYIAKTYDNEGRLIQHRNERGNVTTFAYDGRDLKVKKTNADNKLFTWHYDENGNTSATIDEESRQTTYTYDAHNRLTRRDEAGLHTWTFDYDNNGNRTYQQDPWGNVTRTEFDAFDNPKQVTNPDTGIEQLAYTVDGEQVWHQDAEQRVTLSLMGLEGRVIKEVDLVGRTVQYSYDDNGNVTQQTLSWGQGETGPASVATVNQYDALDRRVRTVENSGGTPSRTLEFDYDNVGNLLKETRPDGRVTRFGYDDRDRQISVTDALGNVATTQYDGAGNVTKTKTPRGFVSQTTYDVLDRPTRKTDPLDQVLTYTYDDVGNVLTETDKRGTRTRHVYDDLNRLTDSYKPAVGTTEIRLVHNDYDLNGARVNSVTDAEGNVVKTTLDWRGNPTRIDYQAGSGYAASHEAFSYDKSGYAVSHTDENGLITRTSYHDDGQVASITNPEQETSHFAYDLFGNKARESKPLNNARYWHYDGLGRLAKVVNAQSQASRFVYDLNDNLTDQTTPGANTGETHVGYTYDVLNRKESHIQYKANGNLTVTFDSYDKDGNLKQYTDASGQVFGYDYDELGRQVRQTLPAGSDVSKIEKTYDANNNVDVITEYQASGGTDVTDHDYDKLDRLTSLTQRGKTISYGYDDNGNRTSVSSPGGSTTYTYDARNRLKTSTSNGQATTHTWYPNGWMKAVAYPNGTEVVYSHDDAGRQEQVVNRYTADQSVISQFDYRYDDNGNRTQQTEIQNGFSDGQQAVTDYRFDTLDRLEGFTLTRVDGSKEKTDYTYWPSYDRKTETVTDIAADGTETVIENRRYAYDGTHWLTDITDEDDGEQILYTYDNNGNTLTKVDNTLPTPAQTSFVYNSRNQLIETIRGPPDTGTSLGQYRYNYAGMRIRHLGSARGDIEYLHDGKSVLDEFQNNSTNLVAHYNYADRLISLTTPQNRQYYHYSALRTTANLSNDSGAIQKSYRTDPFGDITKEEGTSVNRNVFTGHEHDTETGLIYMKARFYDPDTGRFLQQDTYLGESGNPPSLYRYLYAYGNPTVYLDVFGFAPVAGYVYDVTAEVDGKKIRYIGQAKDLVNRLSASKHRWKDLIRDPNTSIKATVVEADLNEKQSGRRTLTSARREALGVVEQRMINDALLEQDEKGILQNEATAVKESNLSDFEGRHNVKIKQSEVDIKVKGEAYSRSMIARRQARLTGEKSGGPNKARAGKALARGAGAADVFSYVVMARDVRSDELYEKAPYVLSDSDGDFTLQRGTEWFVPVYQKHYLESGEKKEIDGEEFDILKEEAEALYGKETFFNEFEPGLINPELEKEGGPACDPLVDQNCVI